MGQLLACVLHLLWYDFRFEALVLVGAPGKLESSCSSPETHEEWCRGQRLRAHMTDATDLLGRDTVVNAAIYV